VLGRSEEGAVWAGLCARGGERVAKWQSGEVAKWAGFVGVLGEGRNCSLGGCAHAGLGPGRAGERVV
jgi:hypothetical protein